MNTKQKIKHLPRWIRFTDRCPLRQLNIRPDNIPTEIRQYFGFLFAFSDLKEVRDAVNDALAYATKEQQARDAFRPIWDAAPLALRERFPSDTYQSAAKRKLFLHALSKLEVRPMPDGFGKRNAPPEYHAQRQIFRPSIKRLKSTKTAAPNRPQMRGPAYA